jgi:hypothetical protein
MPKYFTHDNGRRPFMVDINTKSKSLEVYQLDFDSWEEYRDKHYTTKNGIHKCGYYDDEKINEFYNIPVFKTKYKNIFIGEDLAWSAAKGNSILVNKNDKDYIFIGECIYVFQPEDKIIEYFSPVGNNDVPYPYAIGEKYIYFMIEYKFVLLSGFTQSELDNPYMKLYGHSIPKYDEWNSKQIKNSQLSERQLNEIKMYDLWQQLYIKNFKYKALVKRFNNQIIGFSRKN